MGKLEKGIGGSVRSKDKIEGKGETTQDDCKTSNDVRCETWAVKKAHEKKLDVAEMRIVRWMRGVTKLHRIGNEIIRGTTKVGEISKKVQESMFNWYGHVLRREDEYVVNMVMVMVMEVTGKRRRGRPKRRWLDNIRNDLSGEEVQDRVQWRRLIRNIDPT